jgi:hypothetical protein
MGTSAEVRGARYIVCGFVIRSCRVEGETYSWREYLLFGGENVGYRWLMEEDGRWSFVDPVETGDVMDSGGHMAAWRGAQYGLKQQVQARVDYVIGEFYWKVEIGETVTAAEFEGPGGKLSRERSQTEVNYSFVSPMAPAELAAFGIAAPSMPMFTGSSSSGGGASKLLSTIIILIIICIVISVVMGGACGGTSGGGYGGSGWSK